MRRYSFRKTRFSSSNSVLWGEKKSKMILFYFFIIFFLVRECFVAFGNWDWMVVGSTGRAR